MIDPLLRSHLEPLVRRHWHLQFWPRLAVCWLGIGLIGLMLLPLRNHLNPAASMPVMILVALGVCSPVYLLWRLRRGDSDWRWAARQVEARHPELEGLLLTAAQQEPKKGCDFNYLQRHLLNQAITHSGTHNWTAAVSDFRVGAAHAAHLLALVFCLSVLWGLRPASMAAQANAQAHAQPGITVTPGDTELERGSSLVVMARFSGPVPAGVELALIASGGSTNRLPLVRSLADPMFGASVPEVDADFSYHLEYAGKRTRDYRVKVFEFPKLERANAGLIYPAYTGQAPKRIEDTRRLSAVEGTRLDLTLHLNKPVVSARLMPKGEESNALSLITESNRPAASLSQFALTASKTYHLQLVDADGRTNKVPAQFVFDVLKNRRPELKLASPHGDIRPSALEEVLFEGTAWDDFGLVSYGVAYTVAGHETKVIELARGVPAKQKRAFQHVLPLEELSVTPDQLISWFVWADDIGPDGQIRRTAGDLFFGEVRPFDEVFREGQAGQQQQQQSGQQSQQQESPSAKLAELQKQIISATWKLWRGQGEATTDGQTPERETSPDASAPAKSDHTKLGASPDGIDWTRLRSILGNMSPDMVMAQAAPSHPTPNKLILTNPVSPSRTELSGTNARPSQFQSDTGVVRDSQEQALEQAERVKGRVQDPRLAALWDAAAREMQNALEKLKDAHKSPAKLQEALAAEQAAYQALLKLQEREYSVSRSRNRGQSGRQNSRQQQMQQQLEQLELQQQENRYETERQAQAPQSAERREQLQLMNRLQELARRQQDINQRLKELQTALQEARTGQEREEARRQLKRLQEEEQKMLADADELQQRMDRSENQSRFAEQRQQMEQARQDMQRAAEAAQQGAAAQALAAGTRAQRQMQEMREQLRRQSAGEFAEDMREMRAAARELARQQEEIRKKVDALQNAPTRTLTDAEQRKDAVDQLARQKERLTNLVERATQVSQQTEDAEPLASRELYDTLRQFSQDEASSVKQLQEDLVNSGQYRQNLLERLKQTSERDNAKALEATAEMLREGMLPQASQAEERARGSINNLRRGVERAAERVVGDDAETLRLAQRQLDQLTEQLAREMAQGQASGNTNGQQQPGTQAGGQQQEQNHEQQAQQAQSGSNQPRQGQQNQPGQGQQNQQAQGNPQGQQQQAQSNPRGQNEQSNPSQNAQQQARQGTGTQPQNQGQGQPQQEQSAPTPGNQQEHNAQQQGREGQAVNNNAQQNPGQGRQQGQQAEQDRQPQEGQQPQQGQQDRQPQQAQQAQQGQRPQQGQQGRALTLQRNANRLTNLQNNGAGAGNAGSGDLTEGWDSLFQQNRAERNGPITGNDFAPWSDGLREVEEMVEISSLRNEVARARERARRMRQEYKREQKKPDWAVVRLQVMNPLVEVRNQIADELARREPKDKLVPIDRDPVPPKYSDLVRRYYEELGNDK